MNSESNGKKSRKRKQLSQGEIRENLIEAIKALLNAIHDVELASSKPFQKDLQTALTKIFRTETGNAPWPPPGP